LKGSRAFVSKGLNCSVRWGGESSLHIFTSNFLLVNRECILRGTNNGCGVRHCVCSLQSARDSLFLITKTAATISAGHPHEGSLLGAPIIKPPSHSLALALALPLPLPLPLGRSPTPLLDEKKAAEGQEGAGHQIIVKHARARSFTSTRLGVVTCVHGQLSVGTMALWLCYGVGAIRRLFIGFMNLFRFSILANGAALDCLPPDPPPAPHTQPCRSSSKGSFTCRLYIPIPPPPRPGRAQRPRDSPKLDSALTTAFLTRFFLTQARLNGLVGGRYFYIGAYSYSSFIIYYCSTACHSYFFPSLLFPAFVSARLSLEPYFRLVLWPT
jgi:hypothetical protein